MSDFSEPTAIRPPQPELFGATVARPAPSATDETLVRGTQSAPQPVVSSGSAGFAEETRQLLRKRLLVTHGAVGCTTGVVALLGLAGRAVVGRVPGEVILERRTHGAVPWTSSGASGGGNKSFRANRKPGTTGSPVRSSPRPRMRTSVGDA